MGSKPKHIQKYHDIFDAFKNSLTIHTIYPLRNFRDTFKKNRLQYLAKDTLNYTANFIQQEIQCNNRPIIIFYIFSNAGAMLMATINDILCDDNTYNNMLHTNQIFINGIIYESCPGLLTPTLNINHMNSSVYALIPRIYRYPKIIKYILLSINYIIIFIFYCIYKLFGWIRIRDNLFTKFFDKLLCSRNPKILSIPSLFLYSNHDKAVFVNHIDLFISMKRKCLRKHLESDTNNLYHDEISVSHALDNRIKTHNFNNSQHVQHYLMHTTQYKIIVLSFLYYLLKRPKS